MLYLLSMLLFFFFFFFSSRRRHTRCGRDWSSDVCSSDLPMLTCANEQRRRFDRDLERRQSMGLPCYPADEKLLAALQHGLPDCAGVALGLDRLLMQQQNIKRIEGTLSFGFSRV